MYLISRLLVLRIVFKFFLFFFTLYSFNSEVKAQSQVKLHDLRSITDSSGTVHLYYRILEEYDDSGFFTDNIFKFDLTSKDEEIFLKHFYDNSLGFEYQSFVNKYIVINKKPTDYISIGSFGFEFGYIEKNDSLVFEGFLSFVSDIFLSKQDQEIVYGVFDSNSSITIISRDGGVSWPSQYDIVDGIIPDSLKLDFQMVSISPFDSSLMFGFKHNVFVRTEDKGETIEELEKNFTNKTIYYDSNGRDIYFVDNESCSNEIENGYQIIRNTNKGENSSWIDGFCFGERVSLKVSESVSGCIYSWTNNSIYKSEDFGETFDLLITTPVDSITGLTVDGNLIFFSTNEAVYKVQNNTISELRAIQTNVEYEPTNPKTFKVYQNYPNPFNPSTVIKFDLFKSTNVSMEIFDITGKRVDEVLIGEYLSSGTYSFSWNAAPELGSGVYFCRVSTSSSNQIIKITLIK